MNLHDKWTREEIFHCPSKNYDSDQAPIRVTRQRAWGWLVAVAGQLRVGKGDPKATCNIHKMTNTVWQFLGTEAMHQVVRGLALVQHIPQ